MKRCIELAHIAKECGDVAAGAVIMHDGNIISEGIEGGKTHHDITYHAEIEAVRNAVKILKKNDLSDCVLVTTHEPCIMCSYAIRHYGISLIVIGATVGEIGGYSSKLPVLLDRTVTRWSDPPTIVTGILEQECRAINN
ncbi:MAG: nucleoside deaminase [Bacteroidetes bacterium]|nr:nucleoside deaminase [Bacteroidota bacterium]